MQLAAGKVTVTLPGKVKGRRGEIVDQRGTLRSLEISTRSSQICLRKRPLEGVEGVEGRRRPCGAASTIATRPKMQRGKMPAVFRLTEKKKSTGAGGSRKRSFQKMVSKKGLMAWACTFKL